MNQQPLAIGGRIGLFATVFITGAAVMVIELLGTRIIAPFYGASLYVWSSLISITMIALSLGYFIGGRLADRAKRSGLALVIACAGLLTLTIPWLARPILLATDPLGLRAGAFTSAFALFLPALTMLGMVSPFAIKLYTTRIDGVGSSAGSIYAVSTVGSVVGTLILGFFLFPVVGSREILVGMGAILLVLALAIAWFEKRLFGFGTLLPCLLLTILGFCLAPNIVAAGHNGGDQKFKIQSERESLYGWVRVIDHTSNDLRILTSDASAIGAATISNGTNRLTYQNVVDLLPAMTPNMTKALVIGLGAGKMANALHDHYGIAVDTLEIDPAVANAATDYFGFRPSGENIIGDARYEIRHLKGPYDLIIHDCFTGGSEPSHLLTVETLKQIRGLLSDQGIMALNFVAFYDDGQNPSLTSVSRTIEQVFPYQTFLISEPGENFNDFIFLATNKPLDMNSPGLRDEQITWLKERNRPLNNSNGTIISDNFNPLEHLQIAKAENYRRIIIDSFGPDLMVR